MADSYKFLAHDSFIENYESFKTIAGSKHNKSFLKQIEKCLADPLNAGGRIKIDNNEFFPGMIFKIYIGGNEGYRLIYAVDVQNKTIVGIFISTVLRGKLKYGKVGWEIISEKIGKDYSENNTDKFQVFEP